MSKTAVNVGLVTLGSVLIVSALGQDVQDVGSQPQPKREAVPWEYKVVSFAPHNDEAHARVITGLAEEGWQYEGMIHPGHDFDGRVVPRSTVLFRRPK